MHNREKLVKKCSLRDSVNFAMENLAISNCPGFDQDKVNFHWNPRRDTAGQADPTWPKRTGHSIPCAIMLGSGGGELGGRNSLAAQRRVAAVGGSGFLGCAVCVVYSPHLYRCCYCSLCLLFC